MHANTPHARTVRLLVVGLLAGAGVFLSIIAGSAPLNHRAASATSPVATIRSGAAGAGDISGVYDVVAGDSVHCIARLDQSGSSVTGVLVCYGDIETVVSSSAAYLARMDGVFGPPPPPPYTPARGQAIGTISGSSLAVATCATLDGIAVYLTAALNTSTLTGNANAYPNQTLGACHAGTPAGAPIELDLTLTPRTDPDYDDDGCLDSEELEPNSTVREGFDPYNPYDCDTTFNGIAYVESTLAAETPSEPGAYLYCVVDIEDVQPVGADPRLRPFCYVDSPSVVINPAATSGQTSCPPAAASQCGDGFFLPDPPPPYRAVPTDSSNAQLSGSVQAGVLTSEGCYRLSNSQRVYLRARISSTTGHGTLDLWHNFTSGPDPCITPPAAATAESGGQCANAGDDDGDGFVNDGCPQAGVTPEVGPQCLGGANDDAGDDSAINDGCSPQGPDVPTVVSAVLRGVEQGLEIDTDRDNCRDRLELGPNEKAGGRRDPLNRWDYMNPTHDGQNRIDDVLLVQAQYFHDDNDSTPGEPPFVAGYNQDTDRTATLGSNVWNLNKPNGQQRVDDITAMTNHYFHDCF